MNCKHCKEHNDHMQTVWDGLIRYYQRRLNQARADGEKKVTRKKWLDLISKFTELKNKPLPATCDWRKNAA